MKESFRILFYSVIAFIALIGIIMAGSFALAVSPPPRDDDGNGGDSPGVPDGIPTAFTPLSVNWDEDGTVDVTDATDGTIIVTKQKLVVNLALMVGQEASVTLPIVNLSEDNQIFLIKVGAPPQLIMDMEDGTNVDVVGITGHNEWLAVLEADSGEIEMEVSTTDPGFYPFVLELEVVG
jgi:hypothetical protein